MERTIDGAAGRLRRSLAQLAVLAAAVAALALVVQRVPEPVADHMVEADMRAAVQVWQMRIQRQLAAGTVTFLNGSLTPADEGFLRSIVRTSDIHRINLLDVEGRIFWSSNPDLIGTMHEAGEKGQAAAVGEITYEVDEFDVEEIDDFTLHVTEADREAARSVADIDYPVSLNGLLAGAIEFHRDVTQVRLAYVGRVRAVLLAMSGVALLLLLATALILHRSSRAEVRSAEARAREQQALVAEQLRLAREVRLLGELNEWLQSSRSLPELFSMVARFMAHILPGSAGSLYVYSNSRDVLDGAASWSGGSHRDHIRPEDCWGLRRGRAYAFGENAVDFACGHHDGAALGRAVCIPILAHGETIGLMSLTASPEAEPQAFEAHRRLAQTCAEQISMAIANVRMRDELQHQAVRDPLTGLFNQRHMLDALRRLVEARAAREVSLVSLDVDHFKRFNDNFGHDAGDMVLRAVGDALGRQVDGDEVACRVGGEEFALVLPGLGPDEALARAERARDHVAAVAVRYGERTLPRVTVSVGVAHCPTHGVLPQELIRAADEALYAAKAQGRNRVVLAGPRTREAARVLADWNRDLLAEPAGRAPGDDAGDDAGNEAAGDAGDDAGGDGRRAA